MSDEGVGVEENIWGDEETFYNLFVIIQEFGVIGEMDDVDVRRIFWGIRMSEDGVGGEAEYYE